MSDPLNGQQTEARDLVVKWYKKYRDMKTRKQFFFLSGDAGTGKTFLAKHVVELCCGMDRAVFIAPTGKAASRLRQKGCLNAQTMHHFIYNFGGIGDDEELIFSAKGELDEQPLLIVLDEASMVGAYDMERILDHNIPVLALGDICQVPPVKAKAFFTKDNIDYRLTEIMRQKGNSNIIRASRVIRDGFSLPVREYGDVSVRVGKPPAKLLKEYSSEDAQIICSKNSTRTSYNDAIRDILGRSGNMPGIGEKLVCTYNQHSHSFMNGEQAILLSVDKLPTEFRDNKDPEGVQYARIKSLTTNKEKWVKFNPASFSDDFDIRKAALQDVGGFDFGYTLTVHKSQGSEWSKVMVLEEILRSIPYRLMMYTAVTRAVDHLIVYKNQ